MTRWLLGVSSLLLLLGCKDPVAPMVPMCNDDYRPASCMGEQECETDDDGCRVCRCVDEGKPADPTQE